MSIGIYAIFMVNNYFEVDFIAINIYDTKNIHVLDNDFNSL